MSRVALGRTVGWWYQYGTDGTRKIVERRDGIGLSSFVVVRKKLWIRTLWKFGMPKGK